MSRDGRCNPIVIGAIEFPSQVAALKHYGVNKHTFATRIQCGWDVIEAIITPADPKKGRKKK